MEKWRSEEGTKFEILNPPLKRLTQMGIHNGEVSESRGQQIGQCCRKLRWFWTLPWVILESMFVSEMMLMPEKSSACSITSIFLGFRFSRSGLGPENSSFITQRD